MSEKFSPTLRISDLNDFIAPSQICIVSLNGSKAGLTIQDKLEGLKVAKVAPAVKQLAPEPVKISLKDCLACSGCITSAETVMLEKQSSEEFLASINKGKAVIVSLSPQSRASIAVHYGLSPLQVYKKLTTFFKSLGVKAVFDRSSSRDLSLIEACNELLLDTSKINPAMISKGKLLCPCFHQLAQVGSVMQKKLLDPTFFPIFRQ